jgi:UDP-2,3-diacylglucosamine pyrophosphatase LpxH
MDTDILLNRGVVVHISDLHINSKTKHRAVELFSFIASYYKESDSKPTIVVTGDIVDGYDENYNIKKIKMAYKKQYRFANKVFDEMKELGFKIFICPGNHDYPPSGDESFKKLRYICDDFFKDYYSLNKLKYPLFFRHGDCDFIVMNSNEGEAKNNNSVFVNGGFGKRQLSEFRKSLNGDKTRPLFILMHHHLFVYNIPFSRLYDASKFLDIIKSKNSGMSKNIIVVCGHVHNNYPRKFSRKYINTIVESCSSTAISRINTLNFIEITPFSQKNKVVFMQAKIRKKKFGKVNENYKFKLINSGPIRKSLGLIPWSFVSKYICCGFF